MIVSVHGFCGSETSAASQQIIPTPESWFSLTVQSVKY